MASQLGGIIVIGASAGGLPVITELWKAMAGRNSYPVVLVQHVAKGGDRFLADQLACFGDAVVAENWMPLKPGRLHIAPYDYHLLVEDQSHLVLTLDEKVHFCRPSIDLLFKSAARVFGHSTIGVVLTGANEDGAEGAASIAQAGGRVVVQAPNTAEVPVMPEAVLQAVPEAISVSPSLMAQSILELQYDQ